MLKGVFISVNNGIKNFEDADFVEEDLGVDKIQKLDRKLGFTDEDGKVHGLQKNYRVMCDEDGLLKNQMFLTGRENNGFEMLAGNLFVCGIAEDGSDRSLTKEEIEEVKSCVFRGVLRYSF